MIEHVIFDCFGTLIDTGSGSLDAVKTILITSGWGAEDCLFVGDSYFDDVLGPKNVGMKGALLDRKGKFDVRMVDIKPDYRIGSLLELIDIVRGEE